VALREDKDKAGALKRIIALGGKSGASTGLAKVQDRWNEHLRHTGREEI
jgi:hypothetical protein